MSVNYNVYRSLNKDKCDSGLQNVKVYPWDNWKDFDIVISFNGQNYPTNRWYAENTQEASIYNFTITITPRNGAVFNTSAKILSTNLNDGVLTELEPENIHTFTESKIIINLLKKFRPSRFSSSSYALWLDDVLKASTPTHSVDWTCGNTDWQKEVDITPASPVVIEENSSVDVIVKAKSGYKFSDTDGVSWSAGIDSGDFERQADGSYKFNVVYDDWNDGDSFEINYTITADTPVIQTAELQYTCESKTWRQEVTISPDSPVTVEQGKTVRLKVAAKDGYYFGTEDSVYAWVSDIDKVDFNLDTDGSYYYDVNYDDVDSYVWRIGYTISKGGTPEPSGSYPNFYTVYAPTADNMKVVNNTVFFGESGNENVLGKFISFKKFFCTLPTDGSKQLTAGSYKFNTVAPLIKESIVTVECGKVVVDEKYGSLVDYNPYSNYVLYLPFIGFVDVASRYITEFGLSVSYEVDVVSGRCLAKVWYYKTADVKICFAEYGGTIASDEPFTQGQVNYRGTYELMTTMQLGDLECKLYVYTKIPLEGNLADYKGLPSNELKKVGDCTGFVSFDSIHVSGVNATDNEKTLIENLLMNGILVD